ncbi:hypothetical protein Trydic_g9865 [Trypoxylus dichotomus]
MQCYVSLVCAFSVLFALGYAAPAPQSNQESFGFSAGGALNTTALVSTFNQKVQLLRRFCPQLFQVIDNVVQNITSQVFSVVGRVILRNGLGGGGSGGSLESRVSVVLPTFPPDEDDYNDEDSTDDTTSGGLDIRIVDSRTSTTPVSNEIPLSANDVDTEGAPFTDNTNPSLSDIKLNSIDAILNGILDVQNSEEINSSNDAETSTIKNIEMVVSKETGDEVTTTETNIRFDIKVVQNGSVVNTIPLIGENTIKETNISVKKRSPANVIGRSRRVIREVEADQEPAASGGNGPDPADLSDIDTEDSERDKRYLPFSGEAHVSAGGGSGNFLFDIIRLIAGSGATEESDEKDNGAGAGGVAEIDVAKTADGYTEGIPGPITRLFVIANRGLANLVQDLILRLAQTSERIVNFKARLITALI